MDPRGVLVVLYVAAILLPLVALVWSLVDAARDRARYRDVVPGSLAEINADYSAEARIRMRQQMVRRPLRDLAFVGGGVVLASVAGIWSLFLPAA
jgi:hypothetical protein